MTLPIEDQTPLRKYWRLTAVPGRDVYELQIFVYYDHWEDVRTFHFGRDSHWQRVQPGLIYSNPIEITGATFAKGEAEAIVRRHLLEASIEFTDDEIYLALGVQPF